MIASFEAPSAYDVNRFYAWVLERVNPPHAQSGLHPVTELARERGGGASFNVDWARTAGLGRYLNLLSAMELGIPEPAWGPRPAGWNIPVSWYDRLPKYLACASGLASTVSESPDTSTRPSQMM